MPVSLLKTPKLDERRERWIAAMLSGKILIPPTKAGVPSI